MIRHRQFSLTNPNLCSPTSNNFLHKSPILLWDAIREALVTAANTLLGSEGDLLNPTSETCRFINLPHPFLTNQELNQIRHLNLEGFSATTLPILFPEKERKEGLQKNATRYF